MAGMFRRFGPAFHLISIGRALSAGAEQTAPMLTRSRLAAPLFWAVHVERCSEYGRRRVWSRCIQRIHNTRVPRLTAWPVAAGPPSGAARRAALPRHLRPSPARMEVIAFQRRPWSTTSSSEQRSTTLRTINTDPRRLSAEFGFLRVLHRLQTDLARHPHVHFIVDSSGVAPDGRRARSPPAQNFLRAGAVAELSCLVYPLSGGTIHLARAELIFRTSLSAWNRRCSSATWRRLEGSTMENAKRPLAGPASGSGLCRRPRHMSPISNSRLVSINDSTVSI